MATISLTMTDRQGNDLRLLCGVAKTLTLPVLVAKGLLSASEAAGIVERTTVEIHDLLNAAL